MVSRLESTTRSRLVLWSMLAAALSNAACSEAGADTAAGTGAAGSAPDVALLSSALSCSNDLACLFSETPRCNTGTLECVECMVASDCRGWFGVGMTCERNRCVEGCASRNACGGCATIPAARSPGSLCSAGMNTCAAIGTYQCTGSDSTECNTRSQTPYNGCGGCVNLRARPGTPCIADNGQQGVYACEGESDVVCL
jgi:hypothetical protein